ncbi:MAG: hypothetical protein ISR43_00810 [Acidimicrobiia bacterium]|nr:hypothetical protein [Actinomycetota bacterium]MBL6923817.1 hypothetical protein [Acidimicrobiia bacterium]MBL6925756.1 hypothetical protein [Acidimicrobiia bacterium]
MDDSTIPPSNASPAATSQAAVAALTSPEPSIPASTTAPAEDDEEPTAEDSVSDEVLSALVDEERTEAPSEENGDGHEVETPAESAEQGSYEGPPVADLLGIQAPQFQECLTYYIAQVAWQA